RITAQLIDATADKHLWSEKFDRELTDIFAIQDEIARAVVSAIEPQLYQAESLRARATPTTELRAWDYAMRALPHVWRFNGRDMAIAEKLLDVALTYDPDYAFAHSLRALVLAMRVHMGWEVDTAPALAKANESAARAAALDPEDAWSHLAAGYCRLLARETADAIAEMEAAIRLNPSAAMAHMALAIASNHAGRSDAGRRAIEEAMRISPRDPLMTYFSAIRSTSEFIDKNYAEGLAWARKATRESPDNPSALRSAAICHAMLGNLEEARAALARVKAIQPGLSMHYVEKVQPFTDPELRERYIAAFRIAGLT
ncbi:MAG: tetratricopeptide repeat protein, partial [Alphaproteobacteria bacterium]|nr:tetratricopeptide repeat protein [Alphaproteobacteria bacterium]